MAPSRPQRMRFDLDDPDGIDAHAVLEPVGYGSLSADGAEVEVNRPLVSLFSQPGAQARWSVGR